jgi:hypothetical protein
MRSRQVGRSVLIGTVTPNRNGRVAPVVLESVIACPFVARISARLVVKRRPGKTLAGHKADRAEVVRAALEAAGIDPDDHDELSISGTDGRFAWEVLGRSRVDEATYAAAIAEAITTRQRWRHQYETAKQAAAEARAGPAPPAAV